MKRIAYLALSVLFAIIIVGCSNVQDSSREEALYVLTQESEFSKLLFYFSVESGRGSIGSAEDPKVYKADQKEAEGKTIIHVVIYQTKESKFSLALLDDNRPPKIVFKKIL